MVPLFVENASSSAAPKRDGADNSPRAADMALRDGSRSRGAVLWTGLFPS